MMLTVQNVEASFGGIRALQGATIGVDEGSITALIGPNGAGKTTLFNAIGGFVDVDSGVIRFKNREITGLKPWAIARQGLSRTFQTPSGFSSMTVWENLMAAGLDGWCNSPIGAIPWPGRSLQESQREASERASHLLDHFELTGLLDKHLGSLSAADLRFVEIARQLMSRPSMLLLDEPAAGFGPDRIKLLEGFIHRLRDGGVTILIIEHNLSFVLRLADHVHVLAAGRVISSGTPDDIVNDEAVIQNYIGGSGGAH